MDVSDDAVNLVLSEAWQAEQVFAGGLIDSDGFIAAHAFLNTFRHSLGIALHLFGGLSRAFADLVRVIFRYCKR